MPGKTGAGKWWSIVLPCARACSLPRTTAFSRLGTAVYLGVWLCMQLATPVAAQDRVRARVGIQIRSGERSAPARAAETVKTGDALRVYVVPENAAYVYVVHNDGTTLLLLNAQEAHTQVQQGALMTLPAPDKFYQIDGISPKESITVICSPTEIPALATLFRTTPVSQQHWTALEQGLMDKSKIDLTHKAEKPFPIVGNVRSGANDRFIETLQISSGNALVVKKYDFQVQK